MNIYLNGQPHQLSDKSTVTQLIEQLTLTGKRIAVELNQEIVPRSQHDTTFINEGDYLEIVHAIGGG